MGIQYRRITRLLLLFIITPYIQLYARHEVAYYPGTMLNSVNSTYGSGGGHGNNHSNYNNDDDNSNYNNDDDNSNYNNDDDNSNHNNDDDNYNNHNDDDDNNDIPLDGGLSFLALAGTGLGIKKLRDQRAKRNGSNPH